MILVGAAVGIWQLLLPPSSDATSEVSQVRKVSLSGYNDRAEEAWRIDAETGRMRGGEESELSDVSVRLLSDDGDDVLAACDTMSYSGQEAIMEGSVKLEEKDGISLTTNEARWDTAGSEISASDVTISIQSSSVVASLFSYQTDIRRAKLSGGVRAAIAGEPAIEVNSNQADANRDSIDMKGDVLVQIRQETYTAQNLYHHFSSETTTLSGQVTGAFANGQISAHKLVIEKDNIEASGGVEIRLTEGFFEESNGA